MPSNGICYPILAFVAMLPRQFFVNSLSETSPFGTTFSEKTAKQIPLGYFMIARRLGGSTKLVRVHEHASAPEAGIDACGWPSYE